MSRKSSLRLALILALLLPFFISLSLTQGTDSMANSALAGPPPVPQVVGTAFTYQGGLLHDGVPVNDTCDFEFRLFYAVSGSSQVGDMVPVTTDVNNGLFTAQLDFGSAAFSGEARWLEISASCTATGPSGTLSPRQELTAAPYALSLRPGAVIGDETSTVRLNREWEVPGGLTYKAGVYAEADGPANVEYGVYGDANWGVYGYSEGASGHGVHGKADAVSGQAYGVAGLSDSPEGAGVYARGAGEHDPDLILGGKSDSNDNGVIFSDMTYPGSDIFIRSNDDVGIHLDRNDDEAGRFYVYRGDSTGILSLDEKGSMWLKDDQGKVVFEMNEAEGGQFNTGVAGLSVNTIPLLPRALPPADNAISTVDPDALSGAHPDPYHHNSITVGADGLGLIAYNGAGNVRVAHCRDVACAVADITTLAASAWQPDITLGPDGHGLVCFQDWSSLDLKVAHCEDTACTTASISTLNYGVDVGAGCSITIGSDGLGLVSYVDRSVGSLKVAHCESIACTTASTNTLGGVSAPIYVETAITSSPQNAGNGLIVYGDSGGLWAAACSDAACSAATITRLDATPARHPAITIGNDRLALISYRRLNSGSADELMAAHCGDGSCTSVQRHSLGIMGEYGDTAIIIGPYGLGMISFHADSSSSNHVAFAICNDEECSSASINRTVFDPDWELGRLSMTLGADDNPLISYFYNDSELRAGHCANPFCAPYFRRR